MKRSPKHQAGFTRVDLVAVIVIIFLLGLVTLPLRGDYESDSAKLICHTNMRQLVRAMHLYSMDNGGLLPLNSDDPTPGRAWVQTQDSFGNSATNISSLQNPATSMLANYLDRRARPFKCPADLSTVPGGGVRVPKARSVSMNLAVGTDPLSPKNPTPGWWLDGAHNHTANKTWRCFSKMSDFVRPIPSQTFMFLDEHPDSINDGVFAIVGPGPLSPKQWIDWPAWYHNGGAGFGMADGSALTHTWISPAPATSLAFPQAPRLPASLPDLNWLSSHATALITDQP
jgi:competence protein ComGC